MKIEFTYKIVISLLTLLARLPLKILYPISDCIYVITYRIIGYRKKTVRHNLTLAFPQKSEEERRKIERKFYHHLGDCMVETIKLLHISDKELDERVKVLNSELIEKMAEENRPIFIFLGHYGNWEWVQVLTHYYHRPTMMNGQIYRPVKNLVMERVMLKIRSRFNSISIPQKRAFRTLLGLQQEGKELLIGFISDQRPNNTNVDHWIDFLGLDTLYNIGGERIGQRVNANYVYLAVEKVKRGHYRMTFQKIDIAGIEGEYPYTQRFMRLMEATIQQAPEYWLWSHKRWSISRQKK